jgi:serine/threonine protein kinase
MPAETDPNATQTFLAIAQSQSLLTPEAAAELLREATLHGLSASQIALERGAMDQVGIDLVQTMLRAGEVFPGYEILEVLGRGGMGVVYRARQINLNREVAIKTILLSGMNQPGMIARFEKEAVTVAGLRHPNIVTAYDFGRQDERLYFVMELLEGEDLEKRITRQGPMDEAVAWGIARQAASGLAHADDKGIVHRDIKPANLLLVEPPPGFALPTGLPMVKITDFGLVLQAGMESAPRLTMAGTSLGTPAYMAPEQIANPAVDCRADIYALGATVYHMISGRPPFAGETIWQTMTAKMKGELPDLKNAVSSRSAMLLEDMLAVDPTKRPAGYPELLERIDHMIDSPVQVTTPARRRPQQSVSWPHRSTRLFLAAVNFLIVATVIGLGLWWRHGSKTPAPIERQLISGQTIPLFAGTLNGWVPLQGQWRAAADAEGARVLSGNGLIRRPLPEAPDYRVSLAVDLHSAKAVELEFALREPAHGEATRYVLRLAADLAQLAQRDSDGGPLKLIGDRLRLPSEPSADASPYREMRIERAGQNWWAWVNGQALPGLTAEPAQESPEIRLRTEGGPAFFDSLEWIRLVERPASSEP